MEGGGKCIAGGARKQAVGDDHHAEPVVAEQRLAAVPAEMPLELARGVLEGGETVGAVFDGDVGRVPRGGGEHRRAVEVAAGVAMAVGARGGRPGNAQPDASAGALQSVRNGRPTRSPFLWL